MLNGWFGGSRKRMGLFAEHGRCPSAAWPLWWNGPCVFLGAGPDGAKRTRYTAMGTRMVVLAAFGGVNVAGHYRLTLEYRQQT